MPCRGPAARRARRLRPSSIWTPTSQSDLGFRLRLRLRLRVRSRIPTPTPTPISQPGWSSSSALLDRSRVQCRVTRRTACRSRLGLRRRGRHRSRRSAVRSRRGHAPRLGRGALMVGGEGRRPNLPPGAGGHRASRRLHRATRRPHLAAAPRAAIAASRRTQNELAAGRTKFSLTDGIRYCRRVWPHPSPRTAWRTPELS